MIIIKNIINLYQSLVLLVYVNKYTMIGNSTRQNITGRCQGGLIQTFQPNPKSSSVRKILFQNQQVFYTHEWWELEVR